MYYTPKHFSPEELLPKDLFEQYGTDGLYLIDDRITWTLDALRERFGKPITVNNWKTGGVFSQRGYRNDPNVGVKFSPHRFGRAADFDIAGVTAEEFRQLARTGALTNSLVYITRIEDNVNWVHIDCMGLPKRLDQSIYFFHA